MKTSIWQEKRSTILFFIFSFISGFVELGGVFYGINNQFTVVQIASIGLAYQLGNLVPVPIKINRNFAMGISTLSVILLSYYVFFHENYILLFISVICLGMAIQSLRAEKKANVSTTVKRFFRILGFILAPYFNIEFALAVSVFIILTLIFERKTDSEAIRVSRYRVRPLNWIMIVHQMHYFGYVYFILVILYNYGSSLRLIVYGLLFALGWLTYVSVPHILRGKQYPVYFIIGHSFLATVLLLLACSGSMITLIILWMLTGFGGGTVFCIEKINKRDNICSKDELTFSENVGHILGALIGIIIYAITGELTAPIIYSASCAIFAIIGMALYHRKALINNYTRRSGEYE